MVRKPFQDLFNEHAVVGHGQATILGRDFFWLPKTSDANISPWRLSQSTGTLCRLLVLSRTKDVAQYKLRRTQGEPFSMFAVACVKHIKHYKTPVLILLKVKRFDPFAPIWLAEKLRPVDRQPPVENK